MLKYKADLRSLLYMAITTSLFVWQWTQGFNILVYIIYACFSVSVAVMTHNHLHVRMWNNKTLNVLTDWWLTVFYGVPVFTWIPTHNNNHHRYINKEGDSSLTWRLTEENNLLTLLSYPSVSGFYQMTHSVFPYMAKLRKTDRRTFFENWAQVFVLATWLIVFFVLDWQKALLYVFIPQQISAFMVFVFNYVQHVHTDEESRWNNSRNFMGVNWFLFNNGYHTAHHERASVHWSELKPIHEEIVHNINPDLIEKTFLGYVFRTHILGAFIPKYRSKSMRLERLAAQSRLERAQA